MAQERKGRVIVRPIDEPTTRRSVKRFKLGERFSCREFIMRELDGNDDLEIAIAVDTRLAPAQKGDPIAIMEARKTESIRRALVEVDGIPVNNGEPFMAMDNWTQRTMVLVERAFNGLNGVTGDELKNFEAGVEDVSPQTAPAPGLTKEASSDSNEED